MSPVSGSSSRAAVIASGQSQSTSALPNLSPSNTPMFWEGLLKYRCAESAVISSRCQASRTGLLDRHGMGTGEKPLLIHASAVSTGVISPIGVESESLRSFATPPTMRSRLASEVHGFPALPHHPELRCHPCLALNLQSALVFLKSRSKIRNFMKSGGSLRHHADIPARASGSRAPINSARRTAVQQSRFAGLIQMLQPN